ncbi:MAG: ankyrin repeat domain-containing protein [Pyramidobacter sp.]|nr:ankyrin repeat domain-containing protein [Pyramidobacter sp.]
MSASVTGHAEIAETLIKAGADANASRKDGITALMMAALHSNGTALDVLLSCGADAKLSDKDGHNVFWYLPQNDKMSIEEKERWADRIFELMKK